MNRNRSSRGGSPERIGAVKRVSCRSRRRHDNAGPAHRSHLRIDDVVDAVADGPAQRHRRAGRNGCRIRGEAADCWRRSRWHIGVREYGTQSDHLKARGGDLLQ